MTYQMFMANIVIKLCNIICSNKLFVVCVLILEYKVINIRLQRKKYLCFFFASLIFFWNLPIFDRWRMFLNLIEYFDLLFLGG